MISDRSLIILCFFIGVFCHRIYKEKHKKNYQRTLEKLNKASPNSTNEKLFLNYLHEQCRLQESNQLNYLFILILVLVIISY